MTAAEQALIDFERAHAANPARWTTAELEQHNRLLRAVLDEKLPLDAEILTLTKQQQQRKTK